MPRRVQSTGSSIHLSKRKICPNYPSHRYQRGNNSASLLDRVKVIAAVAGGSVTAAYFGAATPREFALFSSKFLEKDNMTSLEWEAANPLLGFVWRCNDVRALTCSGSCLIKGSLRAGPLPTLINRESLLSL